MQNLSLGEKYSIAAAIGLLLLVLLDNAAVMLVSSAVGLAAGLWIARRGEVRRAAVVAMVAFAVSAAISIFMLLR